MDKISENYCREVYLFDRKIVVLGVFFPNKCNLYENSFSTTTNATILQFALHTI